MKALVFGGPGQRSWDTADDPGIQDPTDVIVKVDTTTICGTDLHILKGDVPEVEPGTILGHEAVGTVVETGHFTPRKPEPFAEDGTSGVRRVHRLLGEGWFMGSNAPTRCPHPSSRPPISDMAPF